MTTRTATNKDLAALEQLARDQDWTIEKLSGGHLRWIAPDGQYVDTSMTPGSSRSLNNVRADLKAAGLIVERAEWQRMKRAMRAAEKESAKIVRAVGDALIEGDFLPQNDRKDRDALIYAMFKEEGDVDLLYSRLTEPSTGLIFDLSCDCGKVMLHPQGFLSHIRKCPAFKGGDMKRNASAPPASQRLDCPECGNWYWISQPHLLEKHVEAAHGKKKCSMCNEWVRTRDFNNHVNRSCPERPVASVEIRDTDDGIVVKTEEMDGTTRERKLVPREDGKTILKGSVQAVPHKPKLVDKGMRWPESNQTVTKEEYHRQEGETVDLVAPSRAVDEARVAAIATPEELDKIVHPTETTYKKPQPLRDKIRELLQKEGQIRAGKNTTIGQIVSKKIGWKQEPVETAIWQMAKNGEIIRDMAGRRVAAIRLASAIDMPSEASTPTAKEVNITEPVVTINRGPDVSDDDLWTLLEMVLAEPVQLNRETYGLINEWMVVTRKLFQLKGQ